MLNVKELALAKGFTEDELTRFGVRDVSGHVEIPYFNADGTEYPRVRIRTDAVAKNGSRWSAGDAPLIPYGLHRPTPFDGFAFIAEGETDAWSFWTAGLPALGLPGASNARCVRAEHVEGEDRIYVVQEPGEAGSRFPHMVAMSLYDTGFEGVVHAITLPAPFKDPQEAFAADRAAFKSVMRGCVKSAVPIARPKPITTAASTDVLTFDDLARRSTEHVDWFIEGILRRSGVMLMASQPKVGKSDTARNLAKAVATGTAFLARRCQKGKVLWIGLEEPVQHLHERIEVMQMQGLQIAYVVEQPVGDEAAWLRAVVERHRPDLVIIDTIGRLSNIENVNDYSQVKRATQPILDLRNRFGTTFVLLHHNNHANKTLGSTMWEGAVDTIMSLTRNADGGRFVQTKQRSGIDMEPTALTMDHNTGEISCAESAFIADQRVAERRILAYVATVVDASREELAKHCGRRVSIGRAAVDSLVAAGLIAVRGTGAKGDPRLYSAIDAKMGRPDPSSDIGPFIVEESGLSDAAGRGIARGTPDPSRSIPGNPMNPGFPVIPVESEESAPMADVIPISSAPRRSTGTNDGKLAHQAEIAIGEAGAAW